MKKAFMVSVVAAVVGTSVVSAVSAAPVGKPAVVQVQQASIKINGTAVSVRSIVKNGETLVSVGDIIKSLGAQASIHNGTTTIALNDHKVVLTNNSKQIVVDGAPIALNQPVTNLQGTNFVAVRPLVAAFGGTLAWSAGAIEISTVKLLQDAENPRFAGAGKLIVSTNDANGRTDYLVDAASGKYEQLLVTNGGSDLVVSPQGDKAVYTTADNSVYVMDLKTKTSKLVSDDTSIKPELVWAPDESAVYFLQSDKGTVIAKLSLADSSITNVVDDKVDYKENLNISQDGKKFVYTVTTLGAVTSAEPDGSDVAIDYSGNNAQIFVYDTTAQEPAAVKLTTGTDDKVFVETVDGTKAYYVSVPAEDENAVLKSVDAKGNAADVFAQGDVEQAVLDGGKLYVLAAQDDNNSVIYSIDTATGAQTKLYTVSADVSSITVSGSQIAIVKDGQVLVKAGSAWKAVTK